MEILNVLIVVLAVSIGGIYSIVTIFLVLAILFLIILRTYGAITNGPATMLLVVMGVIIVLCPADLILLDAILIPKVVGGIMWGLGLIVRKQHD